MPVEVAGQPAGLQRFPEDVFVAARDGIDEHVHAVGDVRPHGTQDLVPAPLDLRVRDQVFVERYSQGLFLESGVTTR